jgi:hypothetical protein
MSTIRIAACGLLVGAMLSSAQTPAIPEPGLFFYGPVVNNASQLPVQPTSVQWQISSPSEGVTINATIVVVNGQPFFVARVPFESRTVGTQNFSKTPGVLGLTTSPTTYNRSASCDGLPATILSSSLSHGPSFTFSSADRGVVERVVLGVNKAPIGGGGQTNLVVNADLSVNAFGALAFSWPAVAGETYTILRATNVAGPYLPISGSITATPPKNSFSDTKPIQAPAVFYRIKATP